MPEEKKRKSNNPGPTKDVKIQKNSLISISGSDNKFHNNEVKTGVANFGDGTINNVSVNNPSSSYPTPETGSEKSEDPLITQLRKLLTSRDAKHIQLLGECNEEDELEIILTKNLDPNNILLIRKLIYSVALVCAPDGSYGTAFLSDVPNIGVCLLSVGHNFDSLFKDLTTEECLEELGKYKIWFGNIDGELPDHEQCSTLEKGKPMNLGLFLEKFDFCGSTSYDGERVIFKKDSNGIQKLIESNNDGEDYFAMLLHDDIREKLNELGIEILQCGNDREIKHKSGTAVTLVGHPAVSRDPDHQDWDSLPLRISYGKEVGEKGSYLHFNYDSLPGNSGSPVFGKGFKVKGIHQGSLKGKRNKAHKITKIANWINYSQ